MSKISKYTSNFNIDDVAKKLSKFQNPDNILPTALIEATVTAGRSYRGYKRGGKDELRERIIEEGTCGLIWLFGAKKLNDLFNWAGKNIFKLEGLDLDVGKDALRDPFKNLSQNLRTKTGIYKVASIFSSVLITTTFIGFILPKIKQNITKRIKGKEHKKQNNPQISENTKNIGIQNPVNKNKNPQFKGIIDPLLTAAYNIENKNVWRLLSTDTGILAGRMASARNKDEAIEYGFRDSTSSFCYTLLAPLIIKFLNKPTHNDEIHPEALVSLKNNLKGKMQGDMSLEEFKNMTFGNKDLPEIFKSIKFTDDVVELESLRPILSEDLFKKAEKLSKLQPKKEGKSLLTSSQVKDIFSTSWLSDPEFLKEVTEKATWGKSSDSRKYVPKKTIDEIRQSLDNITSSFYDYTKKHNVETIDFQAFEKYAKNNIKKTTLFTIIGNAVAVFMLAWVIPKLQHVITEKRTGKNINPAMQEFQANKKINA